MFDALANGLIAIFNGLWAFAGELLTLRVALIGLLVLGLGWMAAIEIEDLDRKGTRPTIRRH